LIILLGYLGHSIVYYFEPGHFLTQTASANIFVFVKIVSDCNEGKKRFG
jgi:hypothetical protein